MLKLLDAMDINSLTLKLYELVEQESISSCGKSSIMINSVKYSTYPSLKNFETFLSKLCIKNKISDFLFINSEDQTEIAAQIFEKLRVKVNPPETIPNLDHWQEGFTPLDWNNYIPFNDPITGDSHLYSIPTRSISDMTFKAFEKTISRKEMELIRSKMPFAKVLFNPRTLEYKFASTLDGEPFTALNTYLPPAWRLKPNDNPILPNCIYNFLKTLIPVPEELNYVLDWLHYALVSRNETYLVLNGEKGVGKNIFTDLIKDVIGKQYSVEAPKSFPDSNFTGFLMNALLVIMNETKITRDNHNQLKKFIESDQTLEAKHLEARKMQVYCNYIITNNYSKNNYLEADDRRFSVIDINKEKLTKTMSRTAIGELIEEMHKEENIWNFGHYLIQRKPKYNVNEFYKGARFEELVRVSQPEWQKFVIKVVKSRKQRRYSLMSLREMYEQSSGARFVAQEDALEDFLKNTNHIEGEPIAKLVEDELNPMLLYLVPHDKYLPHAEISGLKEELH